MMTLDQRLAQIRWLLLDVDGVLTDGSIIYGDTDVEVKSFHVRDGSGMMLWRKTGKKLGILTGRQSPVVAKRAKELGIESVIQGAADKGVAFREFLAQEKALAAEVAYIGDDVLDLPVFCQCGLAITVADGCAEAREDAHFTTQARGGRGAVREAIERILKAQGLWAELVAVYRRPGD